MPDTNSPEDGDFAAYLDKASQRPAGAEPKAMANESEEPADKEQDSGQTLQQILVEGQEPTEEFINEFREEAEALKDAPILTDEELERQALSAPGDDGDVRTPE